MVTHEDLDYLARQRGYRDVEHYLHTLDHPYSGTLPSIQAAADRVAARSRLVRDVVVTQIPDGVLARVTLRGWARVLRPIVRAHLRERFLHDLTDYVPMTACLEVEVI